MKAQSSEGNKKSYKLSGVIRTRINYISSGEGRFEKIRYKPAYIASESLSLYTA